MKEEIQRKIEMDLQKAHQQGEPVTELAQALKQGAELEVRLEPSENDGWTLILSAKTKQQRQE